MTTAQSGWADSDESTGRELWQIRPVGHLGKCIVRISSFTSARIGSYDKQKPVATPEVAVWPTPDAL
jgi:hypothetical protein